MYKVFILNPATLKTFLIAADTDYVNAILDSGNSRFLINQAEIFSVLSLKTITNDKRCYLRIPKVILSKLTREGSIEFTVLDGIVEARMLNDKEVCYCTAKFIKQDFPLIDFKFKMNLIERASQNSEIIDLAQFESLEKIMKATKSILNVADGTAMITATNGRVYKEVKNSYKFAVTPFSYSVLKRCSKEIFSIDNYLVAQKDGLMVAVNKCKSSDNYEYKLFREQKASTVCELSLTDLKYFLSRISNGETSIKLDLEKRITHFSVGTISYEIPIMITNLRQTPNANSIIDIPNSVMREVLFNLDTKGAILSKKRTFTQIRINDLLIVF